VRRPGLEEAAALWWREEASEETLRGDGRRWTAWTVAVAIAFTAPGIGLLLLSPWTLPVALGCFAHAWIVPWLQARRGARSVVPLGSERSAARGSERDQTAEGVALGLLGDLVGHRERELLRRCGVAFHSGALGVWLVGERGALMVRPGGHRIDCWCVRVAEAGDLPAARALWPRLAPLARLDMDPRLVQSFKAALELTGGYGGPTRPPRLPLEPEDLERVRAALPSRTAA